MRMKEATSPSKPHRINTMSKMSRSNAKAKAFMESVGFFLWYLKPHTRWDKDIYHLFDGFCFAPNGTLTFVQIKSNKVEHLMATATFTLDKKVNAVILVVKDRDPIIDTYAFKDGKRVPLISLYIQ